MHRSSIVARPRTWIAPRPSAGRDALQDRERPLPRLRGGQLGRGSAFAVQPAYPHSDNLDNEMFFVNTYSGAGAKILLWRFGGEKGMGTVSRPTLRENYQRAE